MYSVLLIVQLISIPLLLVEAGYIFSKWSTRLHGYLFLNCVATLVNNTGYLFEMISSSKEEYLIATQMSYVGRVWIPLSLFLIMLAVCKVKIPGWFLTLMGCFHGSILLMVLTTKLHNLYYTSMEYVEGGLFPYVKFGHGIFHTLYMSTLVIYMPYATIKLVQAFKREKSRSGRMQLRYSCLVIVTECVFFLMNMTGVFGAYDVNSIGYTLTAIFLYLAIFKYDLLGTTELAKDYVIDNISEGIIAVDNEQQLAYVNSAARGIFPNMEEDVDSVIKRISESLETKEPIHCADHIFSADGKELYQKNTQKGTVYVLVDETEHYRYMDELKEQKRIAEEANASKSAFLSIVSHEIRTPMNAVVGMTDLLLREDLTDKQRKYLQNIKNSGAALVMIINDILDQSKIEAGKMEIVEDTYELRPMVDDVQMIIENRIGSKPIHLMVNIDEKIPKIMVGDALRIRQILINLMNNAVKFTESGYIQLSAKVVSETEDAFEIRFGVKDSGQGIREEDLEKLGKAFSQVDTKKNHSKEGTGLGLSISKDFIFLMGGELQVESTYGKGSEFYFIIRQKKADGNGEDISSGKCAWKPEEFTAPDARILVVDDTEINLLLTKEILSPLGIAVDTVASGEEALHMIQREEYHLVFMDYVMPGMDGVETTDKIRKLAIKEADAGKADYYKTLPIIALTGDTSERTREMFQMAGINDVTEKPVEYERLKSVLLKWLPKELIQSE